MKLVYKVALSFLVVLGLSSCETFLNINEDPNNPTSVPLTAQMPAFQLAIADVYGGAFSRFNCMLSQQVEGVARQWESFNQYTGLTPNRFDAAWNNVYENVLNEIKIAQASATDQGANHYLAVLNIMEAFTLMAATDVWDDMPYTEAFKGSDNEQVLNPAFDTQASIYAVINGLLDQSIQLLDGPSGALVPGSEDVFYGGDTDLWLKAARAIKARGLLKFDDYDGARSEASQSFTAAADNMGFQYPDANAAGQWFRFNRDRTGDIEFHPQMASLMTGLNDTARLNMMNPTFIPNHPYMVADFFQELITFREVQFIIAEADARQTAGGSQAGYDAYLAGIQASFNRLGLDDAAYQAYISNPAVGVGVGNLTIETVMTQKYIAMYLQPEVYSDWRRTGIPSLSPVSGNAVPVRWNYAETEILFNSNAPAAADVNFYTDKVGWNQ